MCIRDRDRQPLADLRQIRLSAGGVDPLLPGREAGGQREPCLLYTSDAADDLLCVDLGGRRIIKKKTTKTDQTSIRLYDTDHN